MAAATAVEAACGGQCGHDAIRHLILLPTLKNEEVVRTHARGGA
jgi:hypothetical protein